MYTEIELAWFCGLFEGEGSFYFLYGKPKGLQITMTDLDVLEKVQRLFGGRIHVASRNDAKPHWKKCWRWHCNISDARVLVPLMMPYLGERRQLRGNEFILLSDKKVKEIELKVRKINERKSEILRLNRTGSHTQGQIASIVGVHRTHVNKIINGKK